MLSKVEVLFFTADPLSAPTQGQIPLQLGNEMREILKKVGAARHRRALKFDWNPATRTDDLLQALLDKRPQIVHFSGHGKTEGLVLVSADGTQHRCVDEAALRQLFETLPGDIRVVVLSACFSRPQAKAIADVVGCAIGTRGEIPDAAAITFNAAFYRAIASGYSVKAAYEQARTALALEHSSACECPDLVVRPGIDPAQIVLVSRVRELAWIGVVAALIAVLASTVFDPEPLPQSEWRGVQLGDCTSTETTAAPVATAPAPAEAASKPSGAQGAAADLEEAKAFCRAGDYAAAFPLFKSAAEARIPEAMGFLGIAYQSGEGTVPQPALAVVWLREGAYARDPRAMNALAIAYLGGKEKGYAVDRQPWRAREWFKKAADETGSVEGMLNLGRVYLEERKDSLALVWFQKAVGAGSLDAMIEIGLMHEQGRAVRRNPAEALRLYQMAAEAGSAWGMFEVGKMYQNGVDGRRDYDQAAVWYLKGACAGSADAMYHLGLLYEKGLGVDADRDEAIRWLRRARDAGSPVAAKRLAQLEPDRPGVPNALARLRQPRVPPGCERPHAAVGAGSTDPTGNLALLDAG